jgi:hypothetical protein
MSIPAVTVALLLSHRTDTTAGRHALRHVDRRQCAQSSGWRPEQVGGRLPRSNPESGPRPTADLRPPGLCRVMSLVLSLRGLPLWWRVLAAPVLGSRWPQHGACSAAFNSSRAWRATVIRATGNPRSARSSRARFEPTRAGRPRRAAGLQRLKFALLLGVAVPLAMSGGAPDLVPPRTRAREPHRSACRRAGGKGEKARERWPSPASRE